MVKDSHMFNALENLQQAVYIGDVPVGALLHDHNGRRFGMVVAPDSAHNIDTDFYL